MENPISSNVWKVLVCSYCGNDLKQIDNGVECIACGIQYLYSDSGPIDLRLKRTKEYSLRFNLGTSSLPNNEFNFQPLKINNKPDVDFSNIPTPYHLTEEVISYFLKANTNTSLMLDLGCGNSIHKEACEHAGFKWVGIDYSSHDAMILSDAHALPFRNDSFEFILSIAVLEHIQFPFVMMREAYRVLKYGGKFIGTVAFLEPFHGDSFYHHTHLGVFNSLQYGGFCIEEISPSERWSVLMAQASMGLFPKMPKPISRSLVYPIYLFHKLWWQAGKLFAQNATEQVRVRNTTGAFTFIASKNAS